MKYLAAEIFKIESLFVILLIPCYLHFNLYLFIFYSRIFFIENAD